MDKKRKYNNVSMARGEEANSVTTERRTNMHFKLTKTVEIKDVFKVLKGINHNGKAWQILVVDKDYVNDTDVHTQLIHELGLEVIDCGDKSTSKSK